MRDIVIILFAIAGLILIKILWMSGAEVKSLNELWEIITSGDASWNELKSLVYADKTMFGATIKSILGFLLGGAIGMIVVRIIKKINF